MSNISRQALRGIKNYTKGYSEAQTKVRSATSNDPWGPTGTQMNEIALLTYNQQDFIEIMEMLDKRLNDKGKNWRHVFKALTLLDYILHSGSENVVMYFRENAYIIKTLKEFQYIDEYGKDQGANVRQKAKDISSLLLDEARLRDQRRTRARMQANLGQGSYPPPDGPPPPPNGVGPDGIRRPSSAPGGGRGEDRELQRAIEASKRSAAEEAAKAKADAELNEAIRLSKEEEEKRKREEAERNGKSLFDDAFNTNGAPKENNLLLIDDQLPTQPTGLQAQPQFASFNPYAQFQQQQEEYQRMQAMEAQRQAEEQAQAQYQHQQLVQAQQQEQAWLQQQQQQQQQQAAFLQQQQTAQPLVPQATAYRSNNPFAATNAFSSPSPPPPLPTTSTSFSSSPISTQPSNSPWNSAASSRPSDSFSNHLPPARAPSAPIPQKQNTTPNPFPTQPQQPKRDDGEFGHIAALFGRPRDGGVDTFGNIGDSRLPAHYQANPAALTSQRTGANPFAAATTTGGAGGGFGDAFGGQQNQYQQQQQRQQTTNSSATPFFEI